MARVTTRRLAKLIACVLLFSGIVAANAVTRDYSVIDAAVAAMPKAASVAEVISSLGRLAGDDWEKARGAYVWMIRNISYDVDAFFRGTRPALDAAGVFASGKSVCQGYSELYASIARGLGLEVTVISGYAKAYSYVPGQTFAKTNHAWNAVRLDGAWHFMETTWGAGYVDGTRFVPEHTFAWFDMDPRLFLLNHFPQETRWLLVERSMTLSDYEKAPFVKTSDLERLVDAGLDQGEIVSMVAYAPFPQFFGHYAMAFASMGGTATDLVAWLKQGAVPEAHSYPGVLPRLVEYPRQGKLTAGTKYRFAFRLSGCEQAAVISGGSFTFLTREGDLFSGEAVAASGPVRLSAKIDYRGSFSFWPLLIWQAQ
jgi:hypothetical protein